jgi:hypothetical protein
MSLPVQRRDQRRRLLAAWSRSAASPASSGSSDPRPMAQYAAEAHPERHPGPGTLLPTGLGGLALAALGILVPLAAVVGVSAWEAATGRPLIPSGGRFAATLSALAAGLDPRAAASLPNGLAQLCLLAAAVVAWTVRLMRRQRRDDYKGRYRAWGWLALLLVVTAAAGGLPLGRLVGTAMSDATGIVLGPGGLGWWHALAALAWAVVAPWAVLPLHRRAGTAAWLAAALAAWAGAAACAWLASGRPVLEVAGSGAWVMAAGLALVGLLTAARSVIREVRGLAAPRPARSPEPKAVARPAEAESIDDDADDADDRPHVVHADDAEPTAYVDGSEEDHRHLSKAERKRLKKLARMQRATA